MSLLCAARDLRCARACLRSERASAACRQNVSGLGPALQQRQQPSGGAWRRRRRSGGSSARRPVPAQAQRGSDEPELDLVERLVGKLFGRQALEDPTPGGLKRLSDDAAKELYPAVTDQFAAPLPGDGDDVAALRPLLAQTQLESAPLRMAYDADEDGWTPDAFHAAVDSFGAALVVAQTEGGALVGGYNARGWVSLCEDRDSPASFLYAWRDGDVSQRPLKLPKVGGPALAVVRDAAGQGLFFGPDGLHIPLAPGNERLAKCKLGPYYSRLPDGGKCLFAAGESGKGVQLMGLRAYVAEGRGEEWELDGIVDCWRLDDKATVLFGSGKKLGLLHWPMPGCTLVLIDVHKAPPAVLPLLEHEVELAACGAENDDGGVDGGGGAAGGTGVPRPMLPRIIMTAESDVPAFANFRTAIKVLPLRVRPSDIAPVVDYYLRRFCRKRSLGGITLTPGAVRRLESYAFPGNVRELQGLVERAAPQALGEGQHRLISEEQLWFAKKQVRDVLRLDLLTTFPQLRQFLCIEWWTERINFGFTAWVYPLIVAVLLWGPQDRDHNFALNAFWAWWWPGVSIVYPFLGRVWCSVCPFMITGELVQRWRISRGAELLKWPREQLDQWGAWSLFAMFAAILVWEEVWDLPHTAALSGWLLILITAGAGVCSGECNTFTCYKGSPSAGPESLASAGCPLHSRPAQLTDNKNCTLCMECLRACPHRSVEFRFRFPGADPWAGQKATAEEVALMWMLLGAVHLHHLPALCLQLGVDPGVVMGGRLPHIAASLAVLAGPGLTALAVDRGWRWGGAQWSYAAAGAASWQMLLRRQAPTAAGAGTDADGASGGPAAVVWPPSPLSSWQLRQEAARAPPFLDMSYGYLVLVWGATLAHHYDSLLEEAGRILPVAATTFGLDAPAWLPQLTMQPEVSHAMQGTILLFSAAASLGILRNIGGQSWAQLAPHVALTAAFTAELWHLIMP
ncbi:ATPase AAA [Micractinium conductrix]|uniref:ATPase AAA n=1 Tax=Micractinium conductrix TaxID=554055 RepID=A0A2P6VGX8_9CHLO|nr:ATPase AAA [Micractinium conductrix]|eukprot:PSC73341.1 ATPase AAA [Micractinium conductrix]